MITNGHCLCEDCNKPFEMQMAFLLLKTSVNHVMFQTANAQQDGRTESKVEDDGTTTRSTFSTVSFRW